MAVQSGKFTEVIKHNAAAREFAGSPLHHVEQGLGVIEVSPYHWEAVIKADQSGVSLVQSHEPITWCSREGRSSRR